MVTFRPLSSSLASALLLTLWSTLFRPICPCIFLSLSLQALVLIPEKRLQQQQKTIVHFTLKHIPLSLSLSLSLSLNTSTSASEQLVVAG